MYCVLRVCTWPIVVSDLRVYCSIVAIMMDVTGSVLSFTQMIIDSLNADTPNPFVVVVVCAFLFALLSSVKFIWYQFVL